MGLLDQARKDAQTFSSDLGGFGTSITLTAPDDTVLSVNGMYSRHHMGIDEDGQMVNTQNAHVSIHEQLLIDGGYPYKDGGGRTQLTSHKVGVDGLTYRVREFMPNHTTGLIVLILSDAE